MRVTCRIVDTANGAIDAQHAITETRELAQDADLFTLQDAVCDALLHTFDIGPTDRERDLVVQAVTATPGVGAYRFYVQAREQYLLFTIEGYARAVPLFEKALDVDPHYALAVAGCAETLSMWGFQKAQNGEDALPDYRRALALAKKAVALAPLLADAHRALAEIYGHVDDTGAVVPARGALSEGEARRALALNPLDAEALCLLWCALHKPLAGEGYDYIRKALALNPRLKAAWLDLGAALAGQGKPDEAIAAYRKAIAINPRDALAYYNMGHALKRQRRKDEAIDAFRRYLALAKDDPAQKEWIPRAEAILKQLGAE